MVGRELRAMAVSLLDSTWLLSLSGGKSIPLLFLSIYVRVPKGHEVIGDKI